MSGFVAFWGKEWREAVRSGRLVLVLLLFFVFGISNPALARLTPWLMEMLSDSLAEAGMMIVEMEVNALTAWAQFFKNIVMMLIVVVLFCASSMAQERQRGTWIVLFTRGLGRTAVVCAKALSQMMLWTVGYWLSAAVTYLYCAYFWDNSLAAHLGMALLCFYLFGLFVLASLTLCSVLCADSGGALLGTGAACLVAYLLGLLPRLRGYTPTALLGAGSLTTAQAAAADFTPAILVTVAATAVFWGLAVFAFARKRI